MRKLGNILSGLFLILVFVASITFSYFNTAEIGIALGNIELAPRPIAVWIIGAFVIGGTIGLLLGLGIVRQLKSRNEIRRLKKKLSESQQEVNQLRAMTLKDLD